MAGETVSHVRLIDFEEITPGQIFRAYAGKSTDEKPGDDDQATQRTGNVFIEIDTGLTYFYDEEEEDWILPEAQTTTTEETVESAGE